MHSVWCMDKYIDIPINEPKQTLPNEVVIVLFNAGYVGLLTSLLKYHVAATPHDVVCETFLLTCKPQYNEIHNKKYKKYVTPLVCPVELISGIA